MLARDEGLPADALMVVPGIKPGQQLVVLRNPPADLRLVNFGVVGSQGWLEAESRAGVENTLRGLGVFLREPLPRLSYRELVDVMTEAEKDATGPKKSPSPRPGDR